MSKWPALIVHAEIIADAIMRRIAPTAPIPAIGVGVPVAKLDRYTGTSKLYKEVVKWTVGGVEGELKEVSMVTNNYTKTQFQFSIAGVTLFTDRIIQAPLTLSFPENRLPPDTEIMIECKSTDGTNITVDGSISGKELIS